MYLRPSCPWYRREQPAVVSHSIVHQRVLRPVRWRQLTQLLLLVVVCLRTIVVCRRTNSRCTRPAVLPKSATSSDHSDSVCSRCRAPVACLWRQSTHHSPNKPAEQNSEVEGIEDKTLSCWLLRVPRLPPVELVAVVDYAVSPQEVEYRPHSPLGGAYAPCTVGHPLLVCSFTKVDPIVSTDHSDSGSLTSSLRNLQSVLNGLMARDLLCPRCHELFPKKKGERGAIRRKR